MAATTLRANEHILRGRYGALKREGMRGDVEAAQAAELVRLEMQAMIARRRAGELLQLAEEADAQRERVM